MPMLFYGNIEGHKRRVLAGANLRPLETEVFSSFKIEDLAPRSRLPNIALFWHLRKLNHSALAWHNEHGVEQVAFVPQLLNQFQLLEILRSEYASVMPSPLVFRISNDHEPYSYD